MRVIYEDTVDWEPLRMRFILKGTPISERLEPLAAFVVDWMREQEELDPETWRFCEYSSRIRESGSVEAFCELMPKTAVLELAKAVEAKFPFVGELRLGYPEDGQASLSRIDWFDVPADQVTIDGEIFEVASFTISFTPITVGQFCEFLDATSHVPIPDTIEFPGSTITNFKLTYGKSPRIPMFGLTFDDAIAFCQWAGFRLPTDPELRLFYETATIKQNRSFKCDGENWTSTSAGEDAFYVRRGPYQERPTGEDKHRKPLHRHHYQHLEAPSFRVVRI